MIRLLASMLMISLLAVPLEGHAQQSQDFGPYVVHYNALNTNLIPPQVAQGYGIQRSSSRALLNVTVLKKVMDTPGTPVQGKVTSAAINLTGQRRDVEMREIRDSEGAVYYIGEIPVHNMETYNFTVTILPDGETEALVVKFRQQFFTE